MVEQGLQAAHHLRISIRLHNHPVDKIGAGQVERFSGDALADVAQQVICFIAQQLYYFI